MTENAITPEPTPTTEQLIEGLRSMEPNASRDLAIHLLETGKLNACSSIADLDRAIREHYAPKQ